MVGVIIGGLLAGLLFYFMSTLVNNMKHKSFKNRIIRNIENGSVEKNDLIAMMNYHTNIKKAQEEGMQYIALSEERFPNDREVNLVISDYYISIKDFKKALNKLEHQIEITPSDAEVIYTKGFCLYKLGEYDEAKSFREKAIEIDKSFLNRTYS